MTFLALWLLTVGKTLTTLEYGVRGHPESLYLGLWSFIFGPRMDFLSHFRWELCLYIAAGDPRDWWQLLYGPSYVPWARAGQMTLLIGSRISLKFYQRCWLTYIYHCPVRKSQGIEAVDARQGRSRMMHVEQNGIPSHHKEDGNHDTFRKQVEP